MGFFDLVATAAPIDEAAHNCTTGDSFHLFDDPSQGVTIIGVTRCSQHAHHEVVSIGGGHAHLAPKLVLLARLAIADAFHFRCASRRACFCLAVDAPAGVRPGLAPQE